jgi:putative membrane protein
MTLEAVLASLHLVAILTLVVFLSSQAALCRIEWLNAAVVERLVRLDVIYNVTALALLLTGLARVVWGIKGMSWYVSQPLFHLKVTLVVVMVLLSIWPTLSFRRWRSQLRTTGALPEAREVARVRRLVMVQSHVLPVVAVIAVFWARGW